MSATTDFDIVLIGAGGGSLTDLFTSLTHDNTILLLDVARDKAKLTEYLIGGMMQSADHQFAALQDFFPRAVKQTGWCVHTQRYGACRSP